MPALKFYKRNSLPGTLDSDSFYFILNGGVAESYITNSSGTAKAVGNTAMINGLIDAKLNAYSTLQQVATITARNTAGSAATTNTMFLVTDATGDTSVSSGAALYFYNKTANSYTKVAEYESMDVVLQWANIQGKPSSSPSAIDTAVGNSHTHSNSAVINALSDSSGSLAYNGAVVGGTWNATDW